MSTLVNEFQENVFSSKQKKKSWILNSENEFTLHYLDHVLMLL